MLLDIAFNKWYVSTVKDLVNSTVADQVEWPHRIVVPVGDTPADIMRLVLLMSFLLDWNEIVNAVCMCKPPSYMISI